MRAREETPDIDRFCRGYPDIAADLRPQLEALAEIDTMLDADAGPEAAAASAVPSAVPAALSGYKILGEVGAGGMGRVLLAEDERLGRKVAIKTLNERYANDPVQRARFMQEARAMAQVTHPNIARIYALGPDNEPPHFVMECTMHLQLTLPEHGGVALPMNLRGILADGGKEILAIQTDPGWMVSAKFSAHPAGGVWP